MESLPDRGDEDFQRSVRAALHRTALCCPVQCCAMLRSAVLSCAVLCYAVLCSAVQFCAVLCSAVLYCVVQCDVYCAVCTVLSCAVLYCVVLCSVMCSVMWLAMQCSVVRCGVVFKSSTSISVVALSPCFPRKCIRSPHSHVFRAPCSALQALSPQPTGSCPWCTGTADRDGSRSSGGSWT